MLKSQKKQANREFLFPLAVSENFYKKVFRKFKYVYFLEEFVKYYVYKILICLNELWSSRKIF